MALGSILITFCVLLIFTAVWYYLSDKLSPHMDSPDGHAKVTGSCGDTMEIGLKMVHGKIVDTSYWTDGCSMSRQCLESASLLAVDRTAEEIRSFNMTHIVEEVGSIPDDHLHCAQLAEITLQRALDDCFAGR